MLKKITVTLIFCILCTTFLSAQTVSLDTYGVNPREVASDTTDIFDQPYNGLANVGVQTKMFLKGSSSLALTGATWTLLTKPSGSTTTIETATVTDTSTEIIVFVPDIVGTYVVSFLDGSISDTITINAGTYLGMTGGSVSCITCHASTTTDYMMTGHAIATKKQFDAMEGSSSHFGETCLECHATGYNLNAVNDGFDDHTFTFPGSFATGVYDDTKTAFPDAMARADVQCEACHGTGSEHIGNIADNKMVASLDSKNCAVCHEDNGTHHYFPTQWNASGQDATEFDDRGFHGGHAIGAFAGYAGGRSGCAACHSGTGYVQWVQEGKPVDENGLPDDIATVPKPTTISCAVCHDPHDATNIYQLRLSDTQLGDGTPITFEKYGTGAQCMECHRSRRDAAVYASDPNSGSSHFGPHHGPQADMLIGANAPAFGVELPSSPHDVAGGNSCVDCHMAGENGFDAEGNVIVVGGHSFNMNDAEGNDHVEACTPCHGVVGESFKEKKYFSNSSADHDGDGVEEGLQEEVHGMLEELATFLPQDENGDVDMSSKTNSPAIVRAGYAYMWVEEDRSFGIHNPQFTVALLQVAIESMKYGAITSGNIVSVEDIMNDQGYKLRIVWTAFGSDDGIAKDQVESYTILRQVPVGTSNNNRTKFSSFIGITSNLETGNLLDINGELWDVVETIPAIRYIEYSAIVPTLHNTVEGDTAWTTYKILGKTKNGIQAETAPMSGYSVDNLAPATPGSLAASGMETGIELLWEESLDKDFNYFEIYRSETQGFTPVASDIIATTIDANYLDNNFVTETNYYYLVTAVDFSGNISKFSNEVSAIITDVELENGVPTKYALNQNYPNPFNPSTSIKFSIPEVSSVKITIYDVTGREVKVLLNSQMNAGYYSVNWNASNITSGIYLYQIETSNFVDVKKMVLLK